MQTFVPKTHQATEPQRSPERPGQALEPALRRDMEQRFSHDFSRVRIHADAAASESAKKLSANAWTAGHNISFAAGMHNPQTHAGRRLIAHELAHVVQQHPSGQPEAQPRLNPEPEAAEREAEAAGDAVAAGIPNLHPIAASVTTGIVQRDPAGSDASKAARAKVVAAMEKLKTKYKLRAVSEENNAHWTEEELRSLDASFAKLRPEERIKLINVSVFRTDTLTVQNKGKTVPVVGLTTGTGAIEFTGAAFRDSQVALHEVGHIVKNKAVAAAEDKFRRSPAGSAPEVAAEKFKTARNAIPKDAGSSPQAQNLNALTSAMNRVLGAGDDLMRSTDENQAALRDALDAAQNDADLERGAIQNSDPSARAILEAADRLGDWVNAVKQWVDDRAKATGPRKNLTGFVAIVNKFKLAKKDFAPFTSYVASFWPDKPEEFYAECFATWRNNPAYLRANAKALYDWFEKSGHLEPQNLAQLTREVSPATALLGDSIDNLLTEAVVGLSQSLPGK